MWDLFKWLFMLDDTDATDSTSSGSHTTANLDDDIGHSQGLGSPLDSQSSVNPATGLPMVGSVDTEGNPYGTGSMEPFGDLHSTGSTSAFDDDMHKSIGGDSGIGDIGGGMGGIGGSGPFDD